jgi:hypothetical protein
MGPSSWIFSLIQVNNIVEAFILTFAAVGFALCFALVFWCFWIYSLYKIIMYNKNNFY